MKGKALPSEQFAAKEVTYNCVCNQKNKNLQERTA